MGSPAAAAGVSRILQKAGLKKAVEFQPGVELKGFYASPEGDHVRVEFIPGPFAEEEEYLDIIRAGLDQCKAALQGRYEVKDTTGLMAFPGAMREMPVLEVRSERWGR